MKVGIVTEYFYPTIGGITENVYNFALHLLKRGRDFRIITGRRRSPPKNINEEVRRRILYVGRSIPTAFNNSIGRVTIGIGFQRKFREIFRSEKFDIIHAHAPIFPTLPIIANKVQNAPLVGTFHTCVDSRGLLKYYWKDAMALMGRMAGRIAVSKSCAEDNQKLFPVSFDIIPNGVDVDWWQTDKPKFEKFDDDKINILFLGRPDIRNGVDTLIRAYDRVHSVYPNTRLIIVGGGPLLRFFKSMVPHRISKDVHFEGSADNSRPRYLKTADIFCFLPTIASFGITVLEGMAAGKAMVVSDVDPFKVLVRDGESSMLVPPCDETKIANAICHLIENPELRKRLATNARHTVWSYSWEHVAERHLEYYENILDKGKG